MSSYQQSPEDQLTRAVCEAFKNGGEVNIVLHVGDKQFTIVDHAAFSHGIINQIQGRAPSLMKTEEWKDFPIHLRCKIVEESLSNLSFGGQQSQAVAPQIQNVQMMPQMAAPPMMCQPMYQMVAPPIMYQPVPQMDARPMQANEERQQVQPPMVSALKAAVVSAIRSGFPQAISQNMLIEESNLPDYSDEGESVEIIQKSAPQSPDSEYSLPDSVSDLDFPEEPQSSCVSSECSVSTFNEDKKHPFFCRFVYRTEMYEIEGKKVYEIRFALVNRTEKSFIVAAFPSEKDPAFVTDGPYVKVPACGEGTLTFMYSKPTVFLFYKPASWEGNVCECFRVGETFKLNILNL